MLIEVFMSTNNVQMLKAPTYRQSWKAFRMVQMQKSADDPRSANSCRDGNSHRGNAPGTDENNQ